MGTSKVKKFLAIENAVVDLQYHRGQGDESLQKEFFKSLIENIEAAGHTAPFDENPRAGDALLIPAEVFDDACIEFGKVHALFPSCEVSNTAVERAEFVRSIVFGDCDPVSGGSLANTFHTVQKASVNGASVVNGKFITCVGTDAYGDIFYDDLEGHIKAKREGRQMVCHVFPVGDDRILIATPASTNPAEGNISADLLDDEIATDLDRIAIGGFLFFTGRYHEVMDRVMAEAKPLGKQAPTLVMTAAAQAVAAQPAFRAEFNKAARAMNLIVHANTGEFRRLMNMDTDWRKPFAADFDGLKGHDLEETKESHDDYQAAKQEANRVALVAALEMAHGIKGVYGHDLSFVVTNGSKGIFTVDLKDGAGMDAIVTHAPEKIAKNQIANTVGAGDNFAAGYQLGHMKGLRNADCVRLGAEMAASVIQIPEARLSDVMVKELDVNQERFRVKGGLAYLKNSTLRLVLP